MKRLLTAVITFLVFSSGISAYEVKNAGQYSPAWSPDGQSIAYHENSEANVWDLLLRNVQTGKVVKVTENNAYDTDANWSPDGRYIIYSSSIDGNRNIYLYDVASQKNKVLIKDKANKMHPKWSPDGRSIAFVSNSGGSNQLYQYLLSDGSVKQLSDTKGNTFHPSWSQDGEKIIFDQRKNDASVIYQLDMGSGKVSLIYEGNGSNIAASLNDERLTFSTNRAGNWDIVELNLKTGKERLLAGTDANEMKGVWDLKHDKLVYSRQDDNRVWKLETKSFK